MTAPAKPCAIRQASWPGPATAAGEAWRTMRPAVAPPEEDPNATLIVCSSPPCLLHELDPSGGLGHLGRDDTLALLHELLEARWAGTTIETAWLRAMLRRHIGRLGDPLRHGAGVSGGGAAVPDDDAPRARPSVRDPGQDRLARRLREALPRLGDEALRRDLEQVLGMLERDQRRVSDAAVGAAGAEPGRGA